MKYLIFSLFFVTASANAGWFSGPSKEDKNKVLLSYSPGYKDGLIGVRFWNDSKYTVTKVESHIKGEISGRSTIYDIRKYAESDKILKQFESVELCYSADPLNTQPPAAYKPIFEINEVEFLDGNEKETIY